MPEPGILQAKSSSHAVPVVQRKCAQCEEEEKLQRTCAKCEEEEKLQRKESSAIASGMTAPPIVREVLSSNGRPLDSATRAFFEPRFGRNLGQVRLHTGGSAADSALVVNARAYTVGTQIVLGGSEADLQTNNGRRLLAHELTHVIQQGLKATPASESTEGQRGTHQGTPDLRPVSSGRLQRKVLNHVVEDFQTGAKACLVHIHGEERTALSVAKELRSRRCVNLMHMDTDVGCAGDICRFINFEFTAGGFVFVGKADPNRIFTSAGRAGSEAIKETSPKPGQAGADKVDKKTVRTAAEAELQTFADGELIPSLKKCRAESTGLPVLAVHNNEGLNPAKFKPSASTTRSPNPATGDKANPNDFFFATQASDFDALKGTHNVVLQENPIQSKNDDGSLSVFLADQRYINIEKEGRTHAAVLSSGVHDKVYLQNYALAAEALDLMGVPDMPCGGSPDFNRQTKSIFNRRLGQSGRLPSKIATDKPFQAPEDLSAMPTGDCLIFKDQPALDRRADEWRGKLDRIPLVDMIHWVLGGGKFSPAAALAEFSKQQSCLLTVMAKALKATGKTLPAGTIIKSETRGFDDQKKIWKRKFNFTGAPFDRISDFARKKCSPSLGSDDQWDPAKKDHQACWARLTADEKQKEILMASSAPGVSRHHLGVDFDIGQTDTDLEAKEWSGSGRFSDAYSWLGHNASAFGFIQPFDTKGAYGRGYITERWHWSYFPVAEAALEFVMDHEAEVDAKLHELWGDGKGAIKPEFSFIANNWQRYLFNVEQEGIF
ncbi:MAG: DUF4157 domain-containing protein [Candidatus Sulfotelmatobacter sp.]